MAEWIPDPLYRLISDELLIDPLPPDDPPARTAGEQDHSDPWRYAGGWAPPPGDPA